MARRCRALDILCIARPSAPSFWRLGADPARADGSRAGDYRRENRAGHRKPPQWAAAGKSAGTVGGQSGEFGAAPRAALLPRAGAVAHHPLAAILRLTAFTARELKAIVTTAPCRPTEAVGNRLRSVSESSCIFALTRCVQNHRPRPQAQPTPLAVVSPPGGHRPPSALERLAEPVAATVVRPAQAQPIWHLRVWTVWRGSSWPLEGSVSRRSIWST